MEQIMNFSQCPQTLRWKSLITEDGEAIEGEALDDVTVIGVVTFTICDVRQDNAVV